MKKAKFVEREITEEKKETSYVTPITSNDFVVQEEKSSVFPSNHGLLDACLQASSNPWSNIEVMILLNISIFSSQMKYGILFIKKHNVIQLKPFQ